MKKEQMQNTIKNAISSLELNYINEYISIELLTQPRDTATQYERADLIRKCYARQEGYVKALTFLVDYNEDEITTALFDKYNLYLTKDLMEDIKTLEETTYNLVVKKDCYYTDITIKAHGVRELIHKVKILQVNAFKIVSINSYKFNTNDYIIL